MTREKLIFLLNVKQNNYLKNFFLNPNINELKELINSFQEYINIYYMGNQKYTNKHKDYHLGVDTNEIK